MVSEWHKQDSRPVAYAAPKRVRRLTPSKKLELFKQIKLFLEAGVRQQDICYKLDVGDSTVIRVKQKIKRGGVMMNINDILELVNEKVDRWKYHDEPLTLDTLVEVQDALRELEECEGCVILQDKVNDLEWTIEDASDNVSKALKMLRQIANQDESTLEGDIILSVIDLLEEGV